MRIVIISTSDIDGGAAKASYRLHKALLDQNVDSNMLVLHKRSNETTVKIIKPDLGRIKRKLRNFQFNHLHPLSKYPGKSKTLFSTSHLLSLNVVQAITAMKPDLVHLHWICGEMIKIEDLSQIKAPIVWSLHDMWAFTGGCHYDEECGRYIDQCGWCKVLRSDEEIDLSRIVFRRKEKAYREIKDMTIIGLSSWLSKCAAGSTLLRDRNIFTLPNLIDSNLFKPVNKKFARDVFSLPEDKKLVLFGAMNSTNDPRKGSSELRKALNRLSSDNLELVIFGNRNSGAKPTFKCKEHYIGQLEDEISLALLYNACDVMVVPSLQENLSNVIMESLSCGIPVVGFNIGGNNDLIGHKKNGYLAKPFDTNDLAKGIEWVLNHQNYDDLCQNAREVIIRKFDAKVVTRQYIERYRTILER